MRQGPTRLRHSVDFALSVGANLWAAPQIYLSVYLSEGAQGRSTKHSCGLCSTAGELS